LPWLPWNRWVFRLYRSFTHAGDTRELKRGLAEARARAGLNDKGAVVAAPVEVEAVANKKRGRIGAAVMWCGRWAVRAAVLCVVGVIAYGIGVSSSERAKAKGDGAAAAVGGPVVPVVDRSP